MDATFARDRAAEFHQRGPRSLPISSCRSTRRGEYFQVLSDGCHTRAGLSCSSARRALCHLSIAIAAMKQYFPRRESFHLKHSWFKRSMLEKKGIHQKI